MPSEFTLFRDGFCGPNGHLTVENGEPLILEEFQVRLLEDFFNGATETVALLPKKNFKTSTCAAVALFRLATAPDSDIVLAATTREQAGYIFRAAEGFVARSKWLRQRIATTRREMRSRSGSGSIKVLCAEVGSVDGWTGDLALIDELHRAKSVELYAVLRAGIVPRAGQLVAITTAGADEESPLGVMRQRAYQFPHVQREGAYTYARSADGQFVMHEFSLPSDADVHDMRQVKEANPASVQSLEALQQLHDSPAMPEWQWRRLHCGQWVQGENAAVKPAEWDAIGEPGLTIPEGSPVFIGVDLGWRADTTAVVAVWLEREDRRVVGSPVVLEPPKDEMLDDTLIVDAILGMARRYKVQAIVFDPNTGGEQLAHALEREHRLPFVSHSQKSQPIAVADGRLMEAIRRGQLRHNGDRTLRAHVLAAVARPVGGEQFRFDRPPHGPRVPIDALRALAMCHSVAISSPPPSSVLEETPLRELAGEEYVVRSGDLILRGDHHRDQEPGDLVGPRRGR